MNELLCCPLNKDKAKKTLLLTMLLFCLAPIIINCVAIVPLYVSLDANALYSDTVLPEILKYVQEFFDLAAFSVSYALIIFSVLLLGKKHAKFVVLLYSIFFLSKIPVKLIMNIFIYGSLGSSAQLTLDLAYLLTTFLFEMLQLLVIYFFATTDTNKYLRYLAFLNKKKNKKVINKDEAITQVLPLSQFISNRNPLQCSAIKMSIFITAIKMLSRVLNDISMGAPQSFGEVMVMILYYLSDILYGVVAYIIALIVFTAIYEKLKLNKKTDEENSPSVLED